MDEETRIELALHIGKREFIKKVEAEYNEDKVSIENINSIEWLMDNFIDFMNKNYKQR